MFWLRSPLTRIALIAIAWVLSLTGVIHLPPGLLLAGLLVDETNTVTTKKILPGVADNFFKGGPMIATLKARLQRWSGPLIQENYLFKPMKGGAYKKGTTFDTTKRTTFSGIQFGPRYYEVNVTEYLEELEVEQAGPTAAFSRLKVDMANAALTLSAILEIASYRNGQNIGGVDRTAELNGIEEALNDGTNTSWSGAGPFVTYGGQSRAEVSPALNSPTGLITPSNAKMSFRVLEHSFLSCCIGSERPKLGITTLRNMGYIAETFTPQQKVDTVDPEINWPGFKFNGATIVAGNYVPGADGVNDADLGNYLSTTETFIWLNQGPTGEDAYMRLWIAQSPKFAFGFTGFKGARDDNQVSGQILVCANVSCRSPRYSRILHGFTG